MKKVDENILREYLPVKLHLKDVEEVEQILVDAGAEKIVLLTDNIEFESVAELLEHRSNEEIHDLKIYTYKPAYLYLEITRMWTRLYSGSSETSAIGAFYKIEQVLKRSARKPSFAYSYYFFFVINGLALLLQTLEVKRAIYIPAIALAYSWLVWVLFIRMRRHGSIILSDRSSSNFLLRTKDQLIVGLVLVLVSVGLTLLATTYAPEIATFIRDVDGISVVDSQ